MVTERERESPGVANELSFSENGSYYRVLNEKVIWEFCDG